MPRNQSYSSFGRPFRLQLRAEAAEGFDAPATLGWCQKELCDRWEWCTGAKYCRDCWLQVYQQDHLPERLGRYE